MNETVVDRARAILSEASPYDADASPLGIAHMTETGEIVWSNAAWQKLAPSAGNLWGLLELPSKVSIMDTKDFGPLLATVSKSGREVVVGSFKDHDGEWWCHIAEANMLRRVFGIDTSPAWARRNAFKAMRGLIAQTA